MSSAGRPPAMTLRSAGGGPPMRLWGPATPTEPATVPPKRVSSLKKGRGTMPWPGARAGDLRQGGERLDAVQARAWDGEGDGVGPGRGVGVQDRLPQRAGAAIVGVDDGKDGRKDAAFQGLHPEARGAGTGVPDAVGP